MVTKFDKSEGAGPWIIRIGSFIMSLAIMISSWFLNQAWDRITQLEKEVKQIQINDALINGNGFTSKNWTDAKTILDAERLAMDRRIIRLEETIPVIKDSQLETKKTLDDIKKLIETKYDIHTP